MSEASKDAASTVRPLVLTIGLEPQIQDTLADLLRDVELKSIPMDMTRILDDVDPRTCLIVVGPPTTIPATELAQSLRMQYQTIPLYLVCVSRSNFERQLFLKNGFSDAFLMPMDTATLRIALSEALSKATSGAIKVYRPVKIIDVAGGEPLDFDTSVYLPVNKKYIRVNKAGDALESERIDKMKHSKLNSVYVPAEQMPKFYQYSAKRLREIGNAGTMSATERKEKLSTAVRDLVSSLFTDQTASFESGQAILKDCGEIVKSYIVQGGDSEWYSRILNVLGTQADAYSHAANVSTLAALFSMGMGVGKPEDLALAGLLHDIGISELPAEIQSIDPEAMNKPQFEEYKKHVDHTMDLIKARKIVVPEIVLKAITQHHELYNGTGYPNGLFGDRICKEAQILALADRFEELTCLKPGRALVTPAEAVNKLRKEQVNDPSRIHYNPDLLKNLLALFPV